MADNKKDEFDPGSEFNFDAIAEFESQGDADKPSGSEEIDFADFANHDKGFEGFDEKVEFTDPSDAPDFGSEGFDPTDFASSPEFETGDNPFDFGGPPSPESVELESLSGDPEQEFGDFGGSTSGFTSEEDAPIDVYAEDENQAADSSFVDAFAEETGDITEETDETESTPRESSKLGIKQYAGIAAAIGVVGFIGYSQVLPMFISQGSEPIVADNSLVVPDNAFPTNLPAMPTNVEPEQTKSPVVAQLPAELPGSENGQNNLPSLTLPGADVPTEQPVAVDNPINLDAQPPLELPSADASLTEEPKGDPLDDLVGDSDRGGIVSMKGSDAQHVSTTDSQAASNVELAAITARLDEVVKRIEAIEDRVASLSSSNGIQSEIGTPVTASKPASLPGVSGDGVLAPLKPQIIERVVLRGVSRDIAWISTDGGVVEVKVGDSIPDAGVIESFQNYRGRWIAVTDKGIILPK